MLILIERQVGAQGEVGEDGGRSRQTGRANAQRQTGREPGVHRKSQLFCRHRIPERTNEAGRVGRGLECHAQKLRLDPGGGSLCSRGGLSGLVSPS